MKYHSLLLLKNKHEHLEELAISSGVPVEWIFIEATKPVDLVSEEEAGVRIQIEDDSEETTPIVSDETSIVHGLRDIERTSLRMYTRRLPNDENGYRDRLRKAFGDRYSLPEES